MTAPRPLGKLDQAALWLYEQWMLVTDSADYQELMENLVDETTNVDVENEEAYYRTYDMTEQAVMIRAARAMLNNLNGTPDRVATAAFDKSTERAMQT